MGVGGDEGGGRFGAFGLVVVYVYNVFPNRKEFRGDRALYKKAS